MRVVNLANYGGEYPGSFIPMLRAIGMEARARGWAADTGFDPAASDRRWLPLLRDAGLPVHFSPPIRDRAAVAEWIRELVADDDGPVVLHTHFTAFDLPAVAVARSRPRTAVIWHVHTPLVRTPQVRLRNMVKFATAGRRVALMLPVTPEIGNDVKRRLAPAKRVRFFGNAIDSELFPLATGEERREARARYEVADAPGPVLLHFGWDWERKGGDVFVATVLELRRRGVDALGVTVGGGERASAAVAEAGAGEDAIRVLDPQDRVGDLYAAADVFVSCSRAEGMPFSMLEAIARGTAVVGSDIPGQRLVADQLAGALIGALTAEAQADLVEQALARPPEEPAQARETLERELDVRPWARRLADIYEREALG